MERNRENKLEGKAFRQIKVRINKNIRKIIELEEGYYKQIRIANLCNKIYIEYESNGNKNKTLWLKEYLDEIKPYLKDIINNLKKSQTWKIQLMRTINFMSSKENDEEHVMHSKSDNVDIIGHDRADEAIEELFESLLSRYQIGLKTSMKGSNLIFDNFSLLYYECREINFKCGGSYIDSPDSI